MKFLFSDPICPTPCVGICKLTKEMVDTAKPGCVPEDPTRLFFQVIPGTSTDGAMTELITALKDPKEFEMVKMRPWRDALTNNPIFLSPVSKSTMKPQAYDHIYTSMNFNLLNVPENKTECPTGRRMFLGVSYFHDLNSSSDEQYVREDPIRHIAMLRDPMDRFADQLEAEKEKRVASLKNKGKSIEVVERLPLPNCLDIKPCRNARQLARWCNLQTKMLCGWGMECRYDEDLNATQGMLDKAMLNLQHNYSAILIAEEWDLSVKLLETLHPTYFEGVTELNNRSPSPYACLPSPDSHDVCTRQTSGRVLSEAHREHCWADLQLYEFAKKLFHSKLGTCGLQPASA